MWNTRKKKMFLAICLICGVAIYFTFTQNCAKEIDLANASGDETQATGLIASDENEVRVKAGFEFVKADKYFVPPAKDVVAILLASYSYTGVIDCNICPKDYNETCYMLALFGDKEEAERITGRSLEPMKLIEGREWLEKIVNECSTALDKAKKDEAEKMGYTDENIIFITRDKGYVRGITFHEYADVVFDEYMESALLREYFKELGFIPVKREQAEEYFIPPKDETIAIFIYSDYSPDFRRPPAAIFGDKKLAEKLLYGDRGIIEKMLYIEKNEPRKGLDGFVPGEVLEPNKVFEGREWLEKIMDAYGTALKEASEKERKEYRSGYDGSIVFVTRDKAYIRAIKVGENAICDTDMDSELLKVYFGKLSLTDELLAGKPPKKFELVLAGEYFVPPVDETVAILLHRRSYGKEDFNSPLVLIGDKEQTEKLMERSLEPKKLFEDSNLLKKIAGAYRDALKEAGENNFERSGTDSGVIFFITPKKGYLRIIGIDEDTVYDNYMESEELKKYFDELSITNELVSGFEFVEASNYRLPSVDKVVAILLYPQYLGYYSDKYPPAAILGDKKMAEKLLYENKGLAERLKGKPLKPKKLIEGREWLVKIMDAYRTTLNKAKEKKFICEKSSRGRIVFVTEKNGYVKWIGIDANTVYDKYMESKLLKKYFDELGITNEMGRAKFYLDTMGYDDVIPADETTAILLYPPHIYNLYTPLVLIGDKKATEEIMGISLEPERIIKGGDWIVKIADAYMAELKKAKENKAYSYIDIIKDCMWEIIFVTPKRGCIDSIYAPYMESGLLKEYFDELGLTKELLAGEPNAIGG